MTTYSLLVLSNAVDGMDEEFNRWYTDQHLKDVLSVPGFRCAQRFEINAGDDPSPMKQWRYAAIYELESDDPQGVMAELMRRVTAGEMAMTPSINLEGTHTAMLVPLTPRVLQ